MSIALRAAAHERLFCFASDSLENIRRGVEAGRWAVAPVTRLATKARATKAARYFEPGARGLLYCNSSHSFTVPFVVTSAANPNDVDDDTWPGRWVFPFSMRPIGHAGLRLAGCDAAQQWPFLRDLMSSIRRGGVPAAIGLTGVMVFNPTIITESDWGLILRDLAAPPKLFSQSAVPAHPSLL